MKINKIAKSDFLDLAYHNTSELMERIERPEVFIVQQFYARRRILELRKQVFDAGQATEPSWHALLDDCPDYHRLHDDYPQAHVKARMHAFYNHGWKSGNRELFDEFREIFDLKAYLAGETADRYIANIPSQGQIARVNLHHYPKGGGHQAEHIDPVHSFAKLQTLVQASQIGKDFQTGGLYAREAPGGEKHYVDPHTEPGDLMILSPGIPHGVEAVDPEVEYGWKQNDGRWIVLPIIIHSDYPRPEAVKPRQI